MEGTSAARWCSPWLNSNLKSQMKRHDSWGQLCFKQIGTMSCCCHFLLLYFNIPFHSCTQTLTFSGVSPSHGSPSPNIRNISHLQDPQHILLHDVEVHDSRQWYPENHGLPHAHHRSKNCPQKPFFWGLDSHWITTNGLPAMLVFQRVTKRQHLLNMFLSTLEMTHYLWRVGGLNNQSISGKKGSAWSIPPPFNCYKKGDPQKNNKP